MALTLAAEQKLARVGLIKFFESNRVIWAANVQESYDYVKRSFPEGSAIRPDDVSKVLFSSVEVHPDLKKELDAKKLTQKYWFSDFTDLVIERTWADIVEG